MTGLRVLAVDDVPPALDELNRDVPEALADAVLHALARDPAKKIQAVRKYRELTRAGLAEAKRAVEAFEGGRG